MPALSRKISSSPRPRTASALMRFRKKFGVKVTLSNGEAVRKSQIVLLCVKPQAVEEVLRQIVDDLTPSHVLISVAASVSTRFMENILGKPVPVIRVMPNTPCLIREGMAAVVGGNTCDRRSRPGRAENV